MNCLQEAPLSDAVGGAEGEGGLRSGGGSMWDGGIGEERRGRKRTGGG